jgi:DNA-binding Xre family transcriptional regulator
MPDLTSFRTVVELWDKREALAAALGVSPSQVSKWWQRDNIPAEYWASLLRTELARAAGISADRLTVLAARKVDLEVRA